MKEVESSVLHGLYVAKHLSTSIIFFFGGYARSSLLCGFFLSCSAQASHCGGFSCCRAQALGYLAFSSCSTWVQ